MSFLFQHWLDPKSNEELYNEIIGSNYIGRSNKELERDIQDSIGSNHTSNIERKRLFNLSEKINNEKNDN